ncbi:hypothetical protein GZL_00907 [Streptomyces sp. 769]|nr:hypothetical protein GZL_00907 [Streptomyces sp. 769]
MALGVRHRHVRASRAPAPTLVQHPVGLAHTGGGPEKDLEPAGPRPIRRGPLAAPPHDVRPFSTTARRTAPRGASPRGCHRPARELLL